MVEFFFGRLKHRHDHRVCILPGDVLLCGRTVRRSGYYGRISGRYDHSHDADNTVSGQPVRYGKLPVAFTDVLFASIGLRVEIPQMSAMIILFTVVLCPGGDYYEKIIGCGPGCKLCGYRTCTSLQVGVGMVSRGEVALIVANQGVSYGPISSSPLVGPDCYHGSDYDDCNLILQKIVYAHGCCSESC